jgi:hypothetical protein
MRSRFKTLPLAMVAILALCALGASSASALESKPRLEPAPKEGKTTPFTGTGGSVVLHAQGILGESAIECEKSSMTGEFVTAKKIQNTVLTISGCKVAGLMKFGNKGSTETIKTEPLTGELGYLSNTKGAEPIVGLMLGKEYKKGEARPIWASKAIEYLGGSEAGWGPITGERIGAITPVNSSRKKEEKQGYTLTFTSGTFGREPSWTKFEGGLAEQQLFWDESEKKETKLDFAFTEEVKFTTLLESEIAA